MDLVVGARRVIVTTLHLSYKGEPKILNKCTYPLTAKEIVDTIITEYAVFKFIDKKLVLVEKIDEISLEELKKITPANYEPADDLKTINRQEIIEKHIHQTTV